MSPKYYSSCYFYILFKFFAAIFWNLVTNACHRIAFPFRKTEKTFQRGKEGIIAVQG